MQILPRMAVGRKLAVALGVLAWWPLVGVAEELPNAIPEYVARPDPAFSWRVEAERVEGPRHRWELELVSQRWHGIVWKHTLVVFQPPEVRFPDHMILFITGGSTGARPREESLVIGRLLAERAQARVAMLHQVPNQPLLGDRKEDDLITETWLRYLKDGDLTWLLQLPMTASAARAMDALEALAREKNWPPVRGFVVTGASKRGWTTWLSAVADRRVVAIAPMVIDMLNLRPQMQYQIETWGRYSEQIHDYTSKGLVHDQPLTEREATLLRVVDPYTYRSRLTLPKLLIHGTNDPYWVVDAARLYWDDLSGPKYLHEVPNGDHGLKGGQDLAVSTFAAFFRHVVGGKPWPELQWSYADAPDALVLSVRSSLAPRSAHLWVAHAATKDFRQSRWQSQPMEGERDAFRGRVPKAPQGHVAVFGQLQFEMDGLPYALGTLVRRN
jgi:PhoPQ-activated pathogenicity-related protein